MKSALLLLFATSAICAPVHSPLVQIIFNINREQLVTDGQKPEAIVPVENPAFPEVSYPVPEIDLIPVKPIMKPPTQLETEASEIVNLPEAENIGEQQTETISIDDNNLTLPENTISSEVLEDNDVASEILDDLPSISDGLEDGATIDSDNSESILDNTLVISDIVDEAAENNENQEQNRLPDDLLIQIDNADDDIAADKLEQLPIALGDDLQIIPENEILGTVNGGGIIEESQILPIVIDAVESENENNPMDILILDEALAIQANEIVQDIVPVDEPTYTSLNEALINEYLETLVIQETAQESDVFINSDTVEEQQMIGMPDGVPVEPIFEIVDIEPEAEENSHMQGNNIFQNKEEDNPQFIVGILGMPDGGPNMPILEEPWYHFW